MRIFIAIDLDEAVIDNLAGLQSEMRSECNYGKGEVKWVKPEQMHLTLKFLGEVEDNRVMEVCSAVNRACLGHERFSIEICGAGSFGRPARVVWAGVEKSEELFGLHSDIEDELESAGWDRDRRGFSGHLTLCRVKSVGAGRELGRAAAGFEDFEGGMSFVESVKIYSSVLGKMGPEYSVVSEIELE